MKFQSCRIISEYLRYSVTKNIFLYLTKFTLLLKIQISRREKGEGMLLIDTTRSLHPIFLTLFDTKKNSQKRDSRLKRLHPRLTQFLYRKLTILLLCRTNFDIDLNNATIRIFPMLYRSGESNVTRFTAVS